MYKHCINMELVKNVVSWGNSAGISVPREWIGSQVKVVIIDRTLEIKKEVFNILEPYLEDILGIYLTGSYARGEQDSESDIDIIAISKQTKKEIISGKYHISITPLDSVRKIIEKNPILILPRLIEAKPIVNKSLLEELKTIKVSKRDFRDFIGECNGIIKINKDFINLEETNSAPSSVIYSLILRLRGLFLIKCILRDSKYSKKDFLKYLGKSIGRDVERVYSIYRNERDEKKVKEKAGLETTKKLLNLLEMEVNRFGK